MKNRSFLYLITLVGLCSLLFLSACKTNKNVLRLRLWHNMNARYNGYFIAREATKEEVKKIEKAHKDDYTKLLPLFIYPNSVEAKTYEPSFDKVIKQSSEVIQRHTIVSEKGKVEIANACKWIDENYIVIGIADLYKRDYFSALEVFEYVSKKYPNPEAKYWGMLWMIRTNNELGSFSKSEQIIDDIKTVEDFPKKRKYQREYAIVSADYEIKKHNNAAAITKLSEAIALTRNKTTKARYSYVLAQLYREQGDNENSLKQYKKVLKLHPNYEMTFNAKINKAYISAEQQGDSKAIVKELIRMSKDSKNKEYLDQIYYSLALLAYKEKDIPATLKYLDLSLENSISNSSTKALAYLKRGDVYYNLQNYRGAKINYDSTVLILPPDYPNYAKIEDKKKSLSDLIINLDIIQLQDSLQRLAKMSDKERSNAVDAMIKRMQREEEKKRQLELIKQQNAALNKVDVPVVTTPSTAVTWYFYNPNTVSFGINDFNTKWGKRKLEDNWRRSQKQQEDVPEEEDVMNNADTTSKNKGAVASTSETIKDRDFYLKSIPTGAEQLNEATIKTIDAYYNVGAIYKEQLLNNEKSVETFEELLSRYPDNKYKLTVYYQLYLTYLAMNNSTKATYYKNILLNDYPNTEYAKLIKNPDYAKDLMVSKNEIESFYSNTYQAYLNGDYNTTIANCNRADSLYSKNPLIPQFDFLKALSIGKTQDRKALEDALTYIIIKHPKGPIKDKAQEILDLMKAQNSVTNNVPAEPTVTPVVNVNDDYYWAVVISTNKDDEKDIKEQLTIINQSKFAADSLIITSQEFTADSKIILAKTLKGKTKTMDYYKLIKGDKNIFAGVEAANYQTFVISVNDYNLLMVDKDVAKYQKISDELLK